FRLETAIGTTRRRRFAFPDVRSAAIEHGTGRQEDHATAGARGRSGKLQRRCDIDPFGEFGSKPAFLKAGHRSADDCYVSLRKLRKRSRKVEEDKSLLRGTGAAPR